MDEILGSESSDNEDIEEMFRNFEAIGGKKYVIKCEDLELFEPDHNKIHESEAKPIINHKKYNPEHKSVKFDNVKLFHKKTKQADVQEENTPDISNENTENYCLRSTVTNKEISHQGNKDLENTEGELQMNLVDFEIVNSQYETRKSSRSTKVEKENHQKDNTTSSEEGYGPEMDEHQENCDNSGLLSNKEIHYIYFMPKSNKTSRTPEHINKIIKHYKCFKKYNKNSSVSNEYRIDPNKHALNLNAIKHDYQDKYVQVPQEYSESEEEEEEREEEEAEEDDDCLEDVETVIPYLEEVDESSCEDHRGNESSGSSETNNDCDQQRQNNENDNSYYNSFSENTEDNTTETDDETCYIPEVYEFQKVINQFVELYPNEGELVPVIYIPQTGKYHILGKNIPISEDNFAITDEFYKIIEESDGRIYELVVENAQQGFIAASDENDTDDTSSSTYQKDQELKMQIFQEKCIKLEERAYNYLNRGLGRLEREYNKRILLNEINRALIIDFIDKRYRKELKEIDKFVKDQQNLIKESLIADLEDEKRLLESERKLKLSDDPDRMRFAAYYRKFCKRTSEQLVNEEPIIKPINFLLHEKDIEEDLKIIRESCLSESEVSSSSSEDDNNEE